ncbi:MAG: nucleoside/nucleotide kinase family protein [Ilumatobacteraceae bacterium]
MAPLPPHLISRVEQLLARGGRVLGIVGPPGAGKSTLADAVVAHFGDAAQLLPMDGFHLANEELARLGRAERKGAPDTFDVDGYLAALQRVRARVHDVLVPRFHREVEEAFAGAIRITTSTRLVVTDGNYLLLQQGRWADVRALLDESWFLRPDDDVRRERLVTRHVHHGRTPAAAEDWVRDVDEANAVRIVRDSAVADVIVDPG